MAVLRGAGRQLLDPAAGERGEILLRAAERRERRATRLVRQRDGHLGPARQRLEQPPLRARQVLEAVREDRPAVPSVEVGAQPLDGPTSQQVAVPERQPVELLAVGGVEQSQIALELSRLQQPGLELGERREERIRKAGEAGRPAEAVQRRERQHPARDERPLRVARDRSHVVGAERELSEDVVERADRAGEQRPGSLQEIAFDPVDVGAVRDDQDRVAFDLREVSLEQARDLAGLRRPDDEGERHAPMVVPASAGTTGAETGNLGKSGDYRLTERTSAGGRGARPGAHRASPPRRR